MSNEVLDRCGVCRSYMDNEDLFCANCGTENPVSGSQSKPLAHQPSHYSFTCTGCGASMSYDASAQALRCPFCGSTRMERRDNQHSIVPDAVVRLVITRQQAEDILREWLGRGFWRPADAARASSIGKMAAVYVPFWVFEAATDTLWTADSSPAPAGCRGDWYPVNGSHRGSYRGILIAGSSVLMPGETDAITPFRISEAVPADQVDLTNAISEEFQVPRKHARPLARAAIEQLELADCRQQVPNRARNVKVNVKISSMRGRPLLLPVWILAYRYKRDVHRVLINGQTGKISGTAPFSYGKLAVAVMVALAIAAVVTVLGWLASR
jgi:predicted RNA-binding Zn-ribbon protein involved in translation (DUF1610 family)